MIRSISSRARGTRRFCRTALVLVALAGIAGCNDLTRPPAKRVPSSSSPSIVDANHNGNAHFFFLPPLMAGLSQGAGTGDASQRPSVVGCELTTNGAQTAWGALIAQFAKRGDGPPTDITYGATAGAYQTNWNT